MTDPIIQYLKSATVAYLDLEVKEEALNASKRRYEAALALLKSPLLEKHATREEATDRKVADRYRKIMKPWILTPTQIQLINENKALGKKGTASTNVIMQRVRDAYNKIIADCYGNKEKDEKEPEEEEEEEEVEDITPLKAKRKVDEICNLVQAGVVTPEEVYKRLREQTMFDDYFRSMFKEEEQ